MDGGQNDTLVIFLDDVGGRINMPREGAEIVAILSLSDGNGAVMFEGVIDTTESNGSRRQRIALNIPAHATDMKSKTKEKRHAHQVHVKFDDVARDWDKKADL